MSGCRCARSRSSARGHAIEARLYAEDPAAGFLPSIGELTHWRMPKEGHGLRIDTGFAQGGKVSQYYDPMLAKVIAHAPTREGALARLKGALAGVEIAGVTTNAAFLWRLLGEEAVQKNAVDTGYIERERAGLSGKPAGIAAHQPRGGLRGGSQRRGGQRAARRSGPAFALGADHGLDAIRGAQAAAAVPGQGGSRARSRADPDARRHGIGH